MFSVVESVVGDHAARVRRVVLRRRRGRRNGGGCLLQPTAGDICIHRRPATTLPPPLEIEEGQVLTVGAEGPAVRALQEALAALGYDPGTPDGVFGPATRSAVMDFQRSNRLNPDGIAGERTLEGINEALELMGAGAGE